MECDGQHLSVGIPSSRFAMDIGEDFFGLTLKTTSRPAGVLNAMIATLPRAKNGQVKQKQSLMPGYFAPNASKS